MNPTLGWIIESPHPGSLEELVSCSSPRKLNSTGAGFLAGPVFSWAYSCGSDPIRSLDDHPLGATRSGGTDVSRLVLQQIHEGKHMLDRDVPGHVMGRREYIAALPAQLQQLLGLPAHILDRPVRKGFLGGQATVEGQAVAVLSHQA